MDASAAPVIPTAPEDTDRTAFGRGFVREPFQRARSFGVAEEALADTAFGKFFGFSADEARAKQEAAEAELRRLESEDPSVQFEDIRGLGTAASFTGEQLGGEARDAAIQAGATATGAGIGSLFGGIGALPGAAIGRASGVAYTTAQAAPQMFAEAIEAQKEAGGEVNLTNALGATAVNLLSEAVADYFVVGKLIPKEAKSRVGSAVKNAIEAGTAEGATEVFQQAVIRGQAGQDLTSPDALAEYAESLFSGMTVGGTIGGVGGFLSPPDKTKERELDKAIKDLEEDQREEAEDAAKRIAFGDAAMAQPQLEEAETAEAEAPVALLPAPTPAAPPAPESLVTPAEGLVTPEAPRPAQPFRWRDYTAATQAVVNAKDASVPSIQKAASADPKKPATPAVAKAIRDRMVADGLLVADKKSKGGFRVVPTRVPDVDQTESYRRTLDDLQQDAQDATAAQQKALLDARRAEQTGSSADARKFKLQADAAAETLNRIQATRQGVEARLPRAAAETAVPRTEEPLSPVADGKAAVPITEAPPRAQATAVSDRAKRLKQSMDYYQREAARKSAEARRLRESGKKAQLPKSDQQRMLDLERDAAADSRMAQGIRAALARPASDIEQDRVQKTAAAAKEASVAAEAAARAPIYTAKEGQLFAALRRRLDNLGLSDVKLVAERVIRPANAPQNALIEGMMDVDRRNGNRIIALALGVYDPKMSQQELFDAISAVMNHEVIHAIRSLGLFTDGEWKTLSDLAARQRYMKSKDGKSVERGYTYLQRAQQMYANDSSEIQVEEAVAEMFRDYVAGRLKIGGKPKTLMDRIKGFFKALWGAHAEAGLTDPNAIFEGVRFGDIGRRERKAEPPSEDTRLSVRRTNLSAPLTRQERSLTVLDRMDPTTAEFIPDGKRRDVIQALTDLNAPRRGIVITQDTPDAVNRLARLMLAELRMALIRSPEAVGWYGTTLAKAKRVAAILHPEISPVNPYSGAASNSYDPNAEHAWDLAMAITSNGMAVSENAKFANEQYEYWKENGTFREEGTGDQGSGMVSAFRAYNTMKSQMTDEQISRFLSSQMPVRDLRAHPLVRELGISVGTNETADTMVNGSFIFGPKIGQGFYQNLRGNFDPLTMDLWFMRLFNRLSGTPFTEVADKTLQANRERVTRLANAPDLTPYEEQVTRAAMAAEDIDFVNEANSDRFAVAFDKIYQRDFKKFYDAAVANSGLSPKSREAKAIGKAARPEGTQLVLASKRFRENLKLTPQDAPKSATSRAFMRQIVNEVRQTLAGEGYVITTADIQAVLWYAEKQLFAAMGVRQGKGGDNDYVDGAIELLRSKGIDDAEISRGLPDTERDRLRYRTATERTAARLREGADADGRVEGGRGPSDVQGAAIGDRSAQAAGDGDRGGADQVRYSRIDVGAGRGDGGRGRKVRGAPPLEGAPRVQGASGPDQNLVLVAEKYARENGIDLRRQGAYVDVDEALAGRIADAFDAMEHDPSNPQVKAAYAELIKQTRAQYDALADAGYKFWFIDGDANKAYASTPWNAMRDIRKNKTMGVFPSISGFGTREEVDVSQNPLLEETDLMWPYGGPDGPKVPVLANDLFRAVHDAFGHGIEGSGFRARGEENAWQAHIRLFTGLAKGALTTETRGQNSWLNYGPFGEQNRKAKVEDTIFADQKVGLLPEWAWKEGLAPDGEAYSPDKRMSIRYAVSPTAANVRRNIQANQKALMYASSADVLAGLISKTRLADREQAKKFTDGVLRRFQDSMLPIGRMVQELSAKGLTITDAMDTYLQENLMHGRVGDRISANKAGLYEPVSKAIKRINVPKARIDQLVAMSNAAAGGKGYVSLSLEVGDNPSLVLANAYLYAAHARERNRYIKANKNRDSDTGSGMSDAEANAIIQWFAGLDPANRSAIDALEKGIRLIVADTNQTRVDGGLISSTVVDPYNFYVPLRGLLDQDNPTNEDDSPGNRTTPGLGARGREDRRATGRYDYATDIVANVFAQNSSAIVRAERNKVGQSFLNLLRSDPSMTDAYAEVLPYAPKIKVSRNGKMVEVPDPKAYDDPDILVVKEDGKETFVRFVDTTMAGAMNGKNGLSIETGRGLIGVMGKINRYLATINTSYNPEFIITNMIRDLTTAGVQINQFEMSGLTADALRGVPSALKGIRSSIRDNDNSSEWAKIYRDFAEAGGQNSTNQMNSIADYMDEITSMLGDISQSGIRGKWSAVKNGFVGKGVGSVLDFLEDYNTVVENGIRVSAYKALLDRGVSRERAAQAARNVTVNFAKRGDYGQLMGAFYLFYNASIQGSFALLNAATRSKKVQKILLGVAASGFVMDAVNGMLSDEDEDGERIYDKIPDHVLEHNLVIMDFLGASDRGYITIPLPYGINMPFNTGRALSRYARDGYSIGEAGTSIMSTVLDVINPLGGTESFENFAAPTVLDPVIDVLGNEDFASKPIYKEGLPFDRTPAPASQLYWSTTSPSAIWIANNLNSLTGGNEVRPGLIDMSPDIIQFWFEFVTGGIGRFAMNSAEVPFTVAEEGITAENIRNIPFVKKVIGSVSEREDMTSYIEGAKQILTAGEELKRARETGDAAWVKQTIGRYGKELRLVGAMRSFESALREVSKMRNRINDNPNIPDEQKKVLLGRLEERRQMILNRANSLIREAGL
jgi:hypothetical protein